MQPILGLRRTLSVGWRHRWKAILLAWVICLGGWAGVHAIPDQYQASARIYADADAILGQTLRGIAVDGATTSQVDTLQRTLLSRPNLERLIARTDLSMRISKLADREALILSLARDIRLTPQSRNLFRIEYRDPDPRVARSVVQATLDLFVERAASNDRQQMENARGFVQQQIATYEVQLREAERRRAEFRARYLDLLPNELLGGNSRYEAARSRLATLRGEAEDAQARRNLIRQQLEAIPATLPPEPVRASGGGGGRVAEMERQLRDLQLRYTDRHPEVIAGRAALAQLRATGGGGGDGEARASPSTPRGPRPNPAREQVQVRLLDAESAVASLERQVRDASEEVERLEALARGAPQLQAEFTNLDRDYTVLRRSYEELLARRESLQIAGAARAGADQIRIEVIEPPNLPTVPVSPQRMLLSAGVMVAGVGAGIFLALVLAMFDRSFFSITELRQLGLPVLGALSGPQLRPRLAVTLAFVGALGLLVATFGVVLAEGPTLAARIPALLSKVLA
ncbi:XrtA system polysaccharide chain length determinant [Muricoccus radiodurans]|uniref:XrtA system polysaccharide chain length determinant n=1 Tax=Muricoccus radiodurans TaxID=2231721 RepID=UPI003CF1C389